MSQASGRGFREENKDFCQTLREKHDTSEENKTEIYFSPLSSLSQNLPIRCPYRGMDLRTLLGENLLRLFLIIKRLLLHSVARGETKFINTDTTAEMRTFAALKSRVVSECPECRSRKNLYNFWLRV